MRDAPLERKLELFEVGPCADSRELGYVIGERFADVIQSRASGDLILRDQLRPFAGTLRAQPLLRSLFDANKEMFPGYWDELQGIAAGSGVPFLDILLINLRKEILPFLAEEAAAAADEPQVDCAGDCSDIILLNDSVALVAHNEDANVALVGHSYLVKVKMHDGSFFTAYTYAGELPSCAFAINSHGVGFTLDSVPPRIQEILQGGIGRNFVSRHLLEASNLTDALRRIRMLNVSVGHSYNLFDVHARQIVNVETASGFRISVREIGAVPFFHANMYLHLHVPQVHDENSLARERRAAMLPASSEEDMLQLLGDTEDESFPIYMTGPKLHTLCTAVFDLDKRTLSIISGNPKKGEICYVVKIL